MKILGEKRLEDAIKEFNDKKQVILNMLLKKSQEIEATIGSNCYNESYKQKIENIKEGFSKYPAYINDPIDLDKTMKDFREFVEFVENYIKNGFKIK